MPIIRRLRFFRLSVSHFPNVCVIIFKIRSLSAGFKIYPAGCSCSISLICSFLAILDKNTTGIAANCGLSSINKMCFRTSAFFSCSCSDGNSKPKLTQRVPNYFLITDWPSSNHVLILHLYSIHMFETFYDFVHLRNKQYSFHIYHMEILSIRKLPERVGLLPFVMTSNL